MKDLLNAFLGTDKDYKNDYDLTKCDKEGQLFFLPKMAERLREGDLHAVGWDEGP